MTGRHRSPVAELDQQEADRIRQRARELAMESDVLVHAYTLDPKAVWRWVGAATAILEELARG